MDQHKFTTLVEALAAVRDPRKRRGQRYPRIFLLTLVAAALASGQQHGRANEQWVQEHAAEVERLWQGHWAIATRGHYPRDVGVPTGTGEDTAAVLDRCRTHGGRSIAMGDPSGPATMAPSPTTHSGSLAPSQYDFDMTLHPVHVRLTSVPTYRIILAAMYLACCTRCTGSYRCSTDGSHLLLGTKRCPGYLDQATEARSLGRVVLHYAHAR